MTPKRLPHIVVAAMAAGSVMVVAQTKQTMVHQEFFKKGGWREAPG